ncbi:peptidase A24 [Sulfolobus sp. A20]|uniref:A24 family peptidase C-terminal domain-containing protein n=1 Tax=Sulfolobaceae TaxID=118883 RepID=UPI000863C2BB|nr:MULTISPECIES: A24 family peptidase C-terminal domain-containing protein [unclassified Sulfolobus]AOL16211.1 peptidase A24 [Sulfolobus sp. A20]
MLIHTSILDLKYREVDPKIWLYYVPLCVFIVFDYHYLFLPLYLYSFAIVNVLFYLLYRFSLIGGADVFLNVILGLSNSTVFPLVRSPLSVIGLEPLLIVLYASVLILLASVFNFIKQYKFTRNLPFLKRIIFALSARRIKVRDFINSKFLFPLTTINEKGEVTIRDYFSIEEDDKYWRDKYRKLVEEGKVSEDDYIWVAWGIPVIPFVLLGYFLSITVGFPI